MVHLPPVPPREPASAAGKGGGELFGHLRRFLVQHFQGGHEATDTGLAYAPVSQAHGHNHIVQCISRCTAAQTSSVPHQVVADCAWTSVIWTLRSARTHHPPTLPRGVPRPREPWDRQIPPQQGGPALSLVRQSVFSLPLIPMWEGTWSHCASNPTFSRMSRTCVHRSTCRAGPDVVCQPWRRHFCALPSTPSTT